MEPTACAFVTIRNQTGEDTLRPHTVAKAVPAGLAMICLVGLLQACQNGPGQQTYEEDEMDASHDGGSADGQVHWSYEGDAAPGRWGMLASSFAVCGSGIRQSPIDLVGAIPSGGSELDLQWQPTEAQVIDTGHAIQVEAGEGSSINLEGRSFSLLQVHFHLPSEHTVDGDALPMEVHFVHQAEEGDLAVIGVLSGIGEADPAIQHILNAVDGFPEASAAIGEFDPRALLPEGRSYFRYAGSLTTPPCSEVVSWVVMTESITVSREQIDAFAALYAMNARPVQALNQRTIQVRR